MNILISNEIKPFYLNILIYEISRNPKTPTITSGKVRENLCKRKPIPYVEAA